MATFRELERKWAVSQCHLRNARTNLIQTNKYPGKDRFRKTDWIPILNLTADQEYMVLQRLFRMVERRRYREHPNRYQDLFRFVTEHEEMEFWIS